MACLRVYIDGLVQRPEVKLSLVVGKEIQQAEKFPMNAPGRAMGSCDDVYYYIGYRLKLEGEAENMGVWTKKRGSMKTVVLIATPCPKSLHGKGEKWIARNI